MRNITRCFDEGSIVPFPWRPVWFDAVRQQLIAAPFPMHLPILMLYRLRDAWYSRLRRSTWIDRRIEERLANTASIEQDLRRKLAEATLELQSLRDENQFLSQKLHEEKMARILVNSVQ